MTTLESPSMTVMAEPQRRLLHIDSVTLLSVYVLLLMAIPNALVFAPLGAAGSPATIYSAALMGFYLVAWVHPGFSLDSGRQPLRLAGVFLTCAFLAAYISANRHTQPTLEMNAADRGLISMLGWLGVLVVAADGISSMDRLRTLLRRVVIGASAMASLAIVQFFTGLDATKYIVIPGLQLISADSDLAGARGGLNRPSATAAHPLELAAVLVISLGLAIHQARFGPPEKRIRRWLPVVLIGAALPMTLSRTAIIGLVVLLIVILPSWPVRDRRRAYPILVGSLLAMWVSVPHLAGTFRNLFGGVGSDNSALSRSSALSEAAKYISQHPWFGRGFGTFLPQTYFFLDDQYLGSAIETGIVGLLVLIALFVTGWFVARSARRMSIDPAVRDLAQSLAGAIAVSAVCFGTFDALSFHMAAGLTFLVLGCTGACWRFARAEVGVSLWRELPRK